MSKAPIEEQPFMKLDMLWVFIMNIKIQQVYFDGIEKKFIHNLEAHLIIGINKASIATSWTYYLKAQ